jgi:hypothetical protein
MTPQRGHDQFSRTVFRLSKAIPETSLADSQAACKNFCLFLQWKMAKEILAELREKR